MPDALLTPDHAADLGPDARSVLEDLYRRTRRDLTRLVRPLVDSTEIAEEVVQDVFVRLLTRGIVPESDAYLRSAALNAARSELRRREVARRHQPRLETDQRVAAPSPLDETCVRRLEATHWFRHLTQLAPRQRDVVVLRYAVGLSERETADRLGVTVGSIKTHASRGLRSLRAVIGDAETAA